MQRILVHRLRTRRNSGQTASLPIDRCPLREAVPNPNGAGMRVKYKPAELALRQ